jgi:hypothetical protein
MDAPCTGVPMRPGSLATSSPDMAGPPKCRCAASWARHVSTPSARPLRYYYGDGYYDDCAIRNVTAAAQPGGNDTMVRPSGTDGARPDALIAAAVRGRGAGVTWKGSACPPTGLRVQRTGADLPPAAAPPFARRDRLT